MPDSSTSDLIALAGNPNAGKTTLFNALTGANHQVANYPGITVACQRGHFYGVGGRRIELIDLPGCYSLEGGSPDQELAHRILRGAQEGERQPDLVLCVVDASNLERHLNLALEVIETGCPVVLALNMVDQAEKAGLRLDPAKLSEELGVPVVPLRADTRQGLVELKQALRHPFPPNPGQVPVDESAESGEARRQQRVLEICRVAARRADGYRANLSDQLDRWLLHPVFGWIAFAALMFAVFWTIFAFAGIPMDWIDGAFGALGELVAGWLPEGDLRSLIVDGIIAGVGGVVIFLPQIVLLFLFIGLMESSGYMARAAYLMDGLMAKAGLSGKAFLPLFSAHACAIPGVMATRTIDSAKERLATIFVLPWMSCSARLPVYFLLIPLLLGREEGSALQALVLFGVYFLGIATAFLVARLLRGRLGPDAEPDHFLLELPAYRAPQWAYIGRHVLGRAWAFVAKAGTVILGLSILLWALSSYPKPPEDLAGEEAAALEYSAMGRLSEIIEPAVRPLGFDAKAGTAILTSFAAREVFNSTMMILYHVEEGDDEVATRDSLRAQVSESTWPDGSKIYTPLTVISLLVFYVYALQCLPTTAVVARELASWKWAAGQFLFMSGFAYLASLLVYQSGRLLGFS